MVTIKHPDPSDYSVGTPAPTGVNANCRPFESVAHVTHAFRTPEISRSGVLSSRLVYDNSSLNSSRIHVVWLSPNQWGRGFRYGTVALSLNWKEILSSRRAYWIEVAEYNTHACRILITDKTHEHLIPYDRNTPTGPWWHDTETDKHYYNSIYCLEFMFEGDIHLSAVSETRLVKHHDKFCSENRVNPTSCRDLGLNHQVAGARFIGRIVGSGEDARRFKVAKDDVENGWRWMNMTLRPDAFVGSVRATDVVANSLARSISWLFGTNRDSEAETMMGLFASAEDAKIALRECVRDGFGLPAGALTE